MHAKFIRYSKTHRHIYRYDEDTRMWVFVACQLTGDMDRCTGGRKPLPRGTEFDGVTQYDASLEAE